MFTRSRITGGALALAVLLGGRALVGQSGPGGPPYTPAQSMAMIRTEPGFRLELVASEPDVQSPVAMDIDEDGRIWVVEMPGYPLDVSPTGRVRVLEDTNGDGRVDRSTLFADNLRLPSGVMRYKKGILVTSPPDLIYFEDVNGDGKADTREVVLTGFAKTNPQHAVNHPVYGLDNWIYLAHSGGSEPVIYRDLFGDKGTDLRFAAMPDGKALDAKGRGVRLKPDEHKVEGLSSRTQYGNAFDVYGHFFAHNNSIHQRHEVIAARYLERNPHLLLPSAMAEISDHGNNNIMPITHGARFDLLTEAGPVHVGVRAHGLLRWRVPRRLRRHHVHRRARAQPRPPRRADAEGRDLRGQPGPRRHGVPGVAGQLVPPGELLHRPRRRALRDRLLPPVHRTPGMGVERPAEVARGALHRQGPGPHLPCRRHDGAGRHTHDHATEAGIGDRCATRRGARQLEHLVAPDGAAAAGARQAA